LKHDIQPYREGLTEIMKIEPVWYRYNGKAGLPKDKRYVGIIAQEMQKIAPHTIGEFSYTDSTGKEEKYLDYDANALTYMLINAVKELQKKNEALEKELQAKNQELEQKIAAIQNSLNRELPQGNTARLLQNYPNPYNTSTIIGYYVPETSTQAVLTIYNSIGQEVRSFELTVGEGKIEVSNQLLGVGTYIYHLMVDGVNVDSKKMILGR
jgi:predicted GIY-YIG superfamily endonuclease